MAKKIFISYDYDNDRHYKNLLVAWNENDNFPFDFKDGSADVSINSNDPTTIKRAISAKINNMDYFLCIIGKNTCKSGWVKWEIDKAIELNKRIVAVKIDNGYTSPPNIVGIGASWALSFTLESIKKAVDAAA